MGKNHPPFQPGDRVSIDSMDRPNYARFQKVVRTICLFTERKMGDRMARYWRVELQGGMVYVIDESGVTTNVLLEKRLSLAEPPVGRPLTVR